jgi:hypothetical protein
VLRRRDSGPEGSGASEQDQSLHGLSTSAATLWAQVKTLTANGQLLMLAAPGRAYVV